MPFCRLSTKTPIRWEFPEESPYWWASRELNQHGQTPQCLQAHQAPETAALNLKAESPPPLEGTKLILSSPVTPRRSGVLCLEGISVKRLALMLIFYLLFKFPVSCKASCLWCREGCSATRSRPSWSCDHMWRNMDNNEKSREGNQDLNVHPHPTGRLHPERPKQETRALYWRRGRSILSSRSGHVMNERLKLGFPSLPPRPQRRRQRRRQCLIKAAPLHAARPKNDRTLNVATC